MTTGHRQLCVTLAVASCVVFALYDPRLWAAQQQYTIAYASLGWVKLNLFVADADGNDPKPLLAQTDRDYHPSFSIDGAWIVFTSERGGSADIYRVHPDGTALQRLTNNPAFDDQGVLSPDGRTLAFVSTRAGRANIWLLELDTKKLTNLTRGSSGDFRPAWSPDGKRIAFSSDRLSPHARSARASFFVPLATEVYVMNRDGSDVQRVTSGPNPAGSPAWSTDGREIACVERDTQSQQSVIISIELATLRRRELARATGVSSVRWLRSGQVVFTTADGVQRVDGSGGTSGNIGTGDWSPDERTMVFSREVGSWPPFEQLPTLDSRFQLIRTGIFPSFAPDGRGLVVNTGRTGGAHNAILLVSADGSRRSTLFDDPAQNGVAPVWSPSGDRIAFGIGNFVQSTPGREQLTSHLAIMKADGSELKVLSMAGDHVGYPGWSRDGNKLVFARFDAPNRGLGILDLRDGSVTTLHRGSDSFPAWSPVDDWIAFTSAVDGEYEVYKIRSDGTGLTQLTRSPGNDAHPKWSPDGQWLAFTSVRSGFKDETAGMSDGEIYVMRSDGSNVTKLTDNAFEDGTPAWAPLTSGPALRSAR